MGCEATTVWKAAIRLSAAISLLLSLWLAVGSAGVAAELQPVLQWAPLPPMPGKIELAGVLCGVVGKQEGVLVVAGGANWAGTAERDRGRPERVASDQIFLLADPDAVWSESVDKLPQPLAYGVSLTWRHDDENVLVCLGGSSFQTHHADAFLLQYRNGRLQRINLPSMPRPVAHHCGALVGDTVYVAGGLEHPDSATPLQTFWALDLSIKEEVRRWRELPPWPGPSRLDAVAGSQQGALFLFSGRHFEVNADGRRTISYLKDAYRYRPEQGAFDRGTTRDVGWKEMAPLPHSVSAAPSPAVALGQTQLYLFGGNDGGVRSPLEVPAQDSAPFSSTILAYDTITDTWAKGGELPNAGNSGEHVRAGQWPPLAAPTTWWRGHVVVPLGEVRPQVASRQILWAAPQKNRATLKPLDYAVLVGYLFVLVLIGFYFARRGNSSDDYFRAGGRVPWWAAGISLFGTGVSALSFMALPGMVYQTNWVFLLRNLLYIPVSALIIYCALPFFCRLNVTTAYEYLEKRFNLGIRLLGSVSFLLIELARMGVLLYLPALALSIVTGVDVGVSILLMGFLATFYTTLGGIEAVIWTDVFQVVILLGGALLSLGIIVASVPGGLDQIIVLGTDYDKFRLVNLTWDIHSAALWIIIVGMLAQFGATCSNQTTVQRYLTTRDEKAAARAIWTFTVMALPSGLLFFMLGSGLWAFYKTHPELLNPLDQIDQIFPWFIAQQLPSGIAGLVIAALFAASMSSMDSSMNSAATAITTDFYRRFWPRASDRACLNLARGATILLGGFGTVIALFLSKLNSNSIWLLGQELVGLLGSGLAGLFVAGIFTRRTSSLGALLGYVASLVVLYFVKTSGAVYFYLYLAIGTASCVVVAWLASWLLPGHKQDLQGLTIYTIHANSQRDS